MKLNPRKPFYMAVNVTERDGSIDLEFEVPGGEATVDGAVAYATNDVEDHGGVAFIYRCIPVRKVSAYRVKVEDLEGAGVASVTVTEPTLQQTEG